MYKYIQGKIIIAVLLSFCVHFAKAQFTTGWKGTKLPSSINTVYDELSPRVSADGKTLFFSRAYFPTNVGGDTAGMDIYFSTYENDRWSPATQLSNIVNNTKNNAVAGLNNGLLYTNNAYKLSRGSNNWLAQFNAFRPNDEPKLISVPNIADKVSRHLGLHLSASGKYLLISMVNTEDSLQQEDIYICKKDALGNWLAPVNIGKSINTPGLEISPFLGPGDSLLFFTTDGHGGYGDADIFVSKALDNTMLNWGQARNLGAGVNTKGFDAHFVTDSLYKMAYYMSAETEDELGDIYALNLVPQKPELPKPAPIDSVVAIKKPEPIKQVKLIPNLNEQVFTFLFDTDKTVPLNTEEVERFKAFISEGELKSLSIVGYTDIVGSNTYNYSLGLRRAEALSDMVLNEWQIAKPANFLVKSEGEGKLAANNSSINGRRLSRRAVVKAITITQVSE